MLVNPRLSQRLAPRASLPNPGIKTNIKPKMETR